jgi:hypothetical protein
MADHKIQSSAGLTMELSQVPKVLGALTSNWAPGAFVVSFKLETDSSILLSKASGAIYKYGVHMVVANLLQVSRFLIFVEINIFMSQNVRFSHRLAEILYDWYRPRLALCWALNLRHWIPQRQTRQSMFPSFIGLRVSHRLILCWSPKLFGAMSYSCSGK